jgi:hypothetical protein
MQSENCKNIYIHFLIHTTQGRTHNDVDINHWAQTPMMFKIRRHGNISFFELLKSYYTSTFTLTSGDMGISTLSLQALGSFNPRHHILLLLYATQSTTAGISCAKLQSVGLLEKSFDKYWDHFSFKGLVSSEYYLRKDTTPHYQCLHVV